MKIWKGEQLTHEWWQLKKGKISGTRFGQVISNRKNRLLYDLLDERMNEWLVPDPYINESMQFGLDNEGTAIKLYSRQSHIRFYKVGAILSDFSEIHMASPDALNKARGIVLEIKSTPNGAIHLQRYFEGPESDYMPQIKNYFAVSDDVKEVHWVSYCPMRQERPLVVRIFKRDQFADDITTGRDRIKEIEQQLNEMESQFKF